MAAYDGARKCRTETIDGGRTQRLVVNLRPATHAAVCTVFNGGHVAQGMITRLNVGTFNRGMGERSE